MKYEGLGAQLLAKQPEGIAAKVRLPEIASSVTEGWKLSAIDEPAADC